MSKPKIADRPRGGASHPCPRCDGDSHVVITRRDEDSGSVRRVRECRSCHHRFHTVEAEENT
jgi:transcriptional regulator NrdR family protein